MIMMMKKPTLRTMKRVPSLHPRMSIHCGVDSVNCGRLISEGISLQQRQEGTSGYDNNRRTRWFSSSSSSSSPGNESGEHSKSSIFSILQQVQSGQIDVSYAESLLSKQHLCQPSNSTTSDDPGTDSEEMVLSKYATLDYTRSRRSNFPEAVFGTGKTPLQIFQILQNMARHYNESNNKKGKDDERGGCGGGHHRAILATRVTSSMYEEIVRLADSQKNGSSNGRLVYHETARILQMVPSSVLPCSESEMGGDSASDIVHDDDDNGESSSNIPRVVVVTAGTTDMYVAEEAAVTIEMTTGANSPTTSKSSSSLIVDRVNDVGVAGLHRILSKLHILQNPNVKCIIVCAGMDGALPSVVGGLARCPVIAVPTSIGYGVAFDGISPLLTMLNSCSPGVAVVNIDNGFGAAAIAHKIVSGSRI